jgi:hypothetical protein
MAAESWTISEAGIASESWTASEAGSAPETRGPAEAGAASEARATTEGDRVETAGVAAAVPAKGGCRDGGGESDGRGGDGQQLTEGVHG